MKVSVLQVLRGTYRIARESVLDSLQVGRTCLCEHSAGVSNDWVDTSRVQSHHISKREYAMLIEESLEVAHDKVGAIPVGFHACFR